MGVSFFFILSGFSLSMGYGKRINDINIKTFLRKRLIKIYPMQLLTLAYRVITFLLIPLFLGEEVCKKVIGLVLNLFLLQAWIPDGDLIFSYNTIAWFLSPIVFFYLVFPFLYKIIDRVKLQYLLTVLMVTYVLAALNVPRSMIQEILYVSPLFRMFDFCIGIASFKLLMMIQTKGLNVKNYLKVEKYIPYVFEMVSILLVLTTIAIHPICDARWNTAALYWIPMSATILLLSLSETQVGGVFCRNQSSSGVEPQVTRCI